MLKSWDLREETSFFSSSVASCSMRLSHSAVVGAGALLPLSEAFPASFEILDVNARAPPATPSAALRKGASMATWSTSVDSFRERMTHSGFFFGFFFSPFCLN
jgi:hypothetical protein